MSDTIITPQNVNTIARTLGRSLITTGYKMMASSYNIKPKQLPALSLSNLIANTVGCEAGFMDGNMFLTTIDNWKQIIASDWLVSTKPYILDIFDCDNFAYCFASHISELFNISVLTAYGKITNTVTGETALHYWNIIATKETDGTLHLYLFDQLNGNVLTELTGKKPIIAVGNKSWQYDFIKIIEF